MSSNENPFVSILTPVYNGEAYLRECIESVLRQTYTNFEYIIVNNSSKDGTLKIAEDYARRDQRIRIRSNDRLLPIIANHNLAFSLISPRSKYCKVVSADDWLYPECVARMVGVAEANQTVGIVGSYQLSGGDAQWYVRSTGLPYHVTVVPGPEMCRLQLIGALSVFGAPTSNLYRSDLVRRTDAFFPNETAEADLSACYSSLGIADFGFVHQVLSYERLHQKRVTTERLSLDAYRPAKISDLLTYGPSCMSKPEIDRRLKELLRDYYECLAVGALNFRDRRFWEYHRERLRELGCPLDRWKLLRAVLSKLTGLALNPMQTAEKVLRHFHRNPKRRIVANSTTLETALSGPSASRVQSIPE